MPKQTRIQTFGLAAAYCFAGVGCSRGLTMKMPSKFTPQEPIDFSEVAPRRNR